MHATEQVELERRQAEAGPVGFRFQRRIVRADALHLRVEAKRGQAIGTLDPVLRAGALDVEHGHAQVAVVGQGEGEDFVQARIGEEITPAQLADGDGRRT